MIKGYCELSAKINFVILTSVLRYGPNSAAYPFVSGVTPDVYSDTLMFTSIEIAFWICMLYGVEHFVRANNKQFASYEAKRDLSMLSLMLGVNNMLSMYMVVMSENPLADAH